VNGVEDNSKEVFLESTRQKYELHKKKETKSIGTEFPKGFSDFWSEHTTAN
jgi:hypothetical protein